MSNFQKVVEFNKTFGVPVFDNIQKEVFTQNPDLVTLRLELIREEVKELEEALNKGDMVETIDALSDILYVVYGAGASFGINLDQTFQMVHDSNMSKTCSTEEEAVATVQWYYENREDFNRKNPGQAPIDPQFRRNGSVYVVYNGTTGKVLKSKSYRKVDFSSMV